MNNYQPYLYLIGWSRYNRWYVGCRYAKNCHPSDLWSSYFTSSKYVPVARYLYGEPDVIRTFPVNSKQDAITRECVVMFYVGAVENDQWINQSNFVRRFHEGQVPQRQSRLTRKKMSRSSKGRKQTPEAIERSASKRRGQTRSATWKAEHSLRMKGKGAGKPKPGTSAKLTGRSMFLEEFKAGKPSARAKSALTKALLVHDGIAQGKSITQIMAYADVSEDTVLVIKRGEHWSFAAKELGFSKTA